MQIHDGCIHIRTSIKAMPNPPLSHHVKRSQRHISTSTQQSYTTCVKTRARQPWQLTAPFRQPASSVVRSLAATYILANPPPPHAWHTTRRSILASVTAGILLKCIIKLMPVVPFNKQFFYPFLPPFLSNCSTQSLNQTPYRTNGGGSVPTPACRKCGAFVGRGRFAGGRRSWTEPVGTPPDFVFRRRVSKGCPKTTHNNQSGNPNTELRIRI